MKFSALLAATLLAGCSSSPVTLTVSAAASLQDCMPGVARLYEAQHSNTKLVFNYGGSGALAQQIRNGAPADVFISAAVSPIQQLAERGLVDRPQALLYNTLVLIAPKDNATLTRFEGLSDPAVKLIAVGDPASVPAGTYAHQVLDHLGLMDAVRPKLVLAKDVRQVLSYVETGNVDAGFVYLTDAHSSPKVRIVEKAPKGSHDPIVYEAAVVKASRHRAEAQALIDFLPTDPGVVRLWSEHGFLTAAP
jgi:molybdate transport system substrate-binding protein